MSEQQEEDVAPGTDCDHPISVVVVSDGNEIVNELLKAPVFDSSDPRRAGRRRCGSDKGVLCREWVKLSSCFEYPLSRPPFSDLVMSAHVVVVVVKVYLASQCQTHGAYLKMLRHLRPGPRTNEIAVPTVLAIEKSREDWAPASHIARSVKRAKRAAAKFGVPLMEMKTETGQGVREVFGEAVRLALSVRNTNTDTTTRTARCTIQ